VGRLERRGAALGLTALAALSLAAAARADEPKLAPILSPAAQSALPRAPGPVPALQRCSVRGGVECDLVDFAALRRARLSLAPGIAEVCAAASPL
jgi:hypothetical protein